MTSEFTREVNFPRYEICTGSVFLNLIDCNVLVAILSIKRFFNLTNYRKVVVKNLLLIKMQECRPEFGTSCGNN